MQEEQIITEIDTPSVPDSESIWDSGDWVIESEELEAWFNSPDTGDGQDFKQRVESGEWDKEHANEILQYMKEHRTTYGEAKSSIGWGGMARRVVRDVGSAFGETRRLINDPARIVQDPWEMMMQKVGYQNDREGFMAALENVEGAFSGRLAEVTGSKEFAAGALMAWEIPKSFVIGVPTSIWNLVTGRGDAGDILDVATFMLPAVRAARSGVAMTKTARGAARLSATAKNAIRTQTQQKVREAVVDALKSNTKNIHIPKKLVKDMLNDPEYGYRLQAKYRQLQRSGKISRNIEFGLQAFNLFVQNEELLLELLGYVGQKITLNALTFSDRGMSMDQAIELAVLDFAEQYEQAPGWTPPEDAIVPPEDQQPVDDNQQPTDDNQQPVDDGGNTGQGAGVDPALIDAFANRIVFETDKLYTYGDNKDVDSLINEIVDGLQIESMAGFQGKDSALVREALIAKVKEFWGHWEKRRNQPAELKDLTEILEQYPQLENVEGIDDPTLRFTVNRFGTNIPTVYNIFQQGDTPILKGDRPIGIVMVRRGEDTVIVSTKAYQTEQEAIAESTTDTAFSSNESARQLGAAVLRGFMQNPFGDFYPTFQTFSELVEFEKRIAMEAEGGVTPPDDTNEGGDPPIEPEEAKPTDEDAEQADDAEGESPVEPEEAAAEGAVEPEETAEDTEPRERLTLGQAQEQYGEEFSDEQVSAIDDPDRISIDAAMSTEEGSHFNVYQDMKNVGGAVRGGGRVLYFANDPKRTEAEAMNVSGSDTIYQTTKHKWTEHEEGEAFYPTFDSLSDMIDYMEKETDKRLGGTLEGTPDRFVRDSARKGRYRVEYDLANIHEVQGSHNLDGSENENFPAGLQPRDQRGSTVDLQFLDEKARDVAPEMLIDHYGQLTDGAPALSKEYPDASVSGSGRLYILKKMLQDYPKQWEKYRDYLRKNVHRYGKGAADVDGDPESILIRRIVDDVDELQLAKDANKFVGLEDTSAEEASSDASYLRDDIMLEWKDKAGLTFEETLNHKDNLEFRQKLLKRIPSGRRGAFLKSDGETFSSRGGERVRAMMLRYVFNGEYGIKMSQILIESKFGEIQNINNMLDVVFPRLALLESYFRTNRREAHHSIAEELARAVGMLNTLKENGDIVGDFFKQDLLFQPKTQIGDLNVPTLQMLYIMDHRIGAYQQLASIFMRYVNEVLELDPAKEELFANPFTKEVFFEQQLYDLLWANPTEILQKQLEAGDIARAKDITRAYVDNLMEQIRRQANQHSVEPTPPEPEPQEEQAAEEEVEEVVEEVVEEQEETVEPEEQDAAPDEEETEAEEPQEETAEPEPEAVTDEEYEQADRAYRQNIRALAQQYFRGILQGDFKGAKRLPNKVEFAEKYTLPRHMPEDVINDLVELQKTISQYRGEIIDEARLREDVQTQFGAHVLQQYDYAVNEIARNEVRFSTPELIYYAPKTKDTPASRTYSAGENGDIFITVEHNSETDKADITFDIPGYAKATIEEDIFGRFTDKQARGAIDRALYRSDHTFTYGDNPRTYAPALTEVQQRRIDKMPPIAEEKAFKDKNSGSRAGMAYAIPGLDPAMRIKVDFLGDNEYYIYVESEMVQSETGFVIAKNFAESPLDAVQRFLADYFDDSVWDGLNEDPDPVDDALDAQGVAGNMPSPLPAEIHLKPKQTTDGLVWLKIADAAGNENPDYSITVDPDPHGLDDGTMEVTVRFPNHKNIDAIMEMAVGNSPEEAAIAAIANLRQFEIGKGGLGSPSGEPYQSTNDTLLESLPPPVKSTERPFGELRVDRVAMEREKYSKSGDTQIYMFDGHKETPQVTVRRLGTKDDPMWAVEIRYPRYNAAAGISYAKTAKGAVNEILKDIEGKDYKWKPLYKGGIYTEIDSVQNAINRRQFATTPAIERRVRGVFTNLRKGLHIDLRGYKITSHKELAVMGQLFRHPGLERFVDFYLDENYNIVGHEVVSFGVPGQTVNPNYPRVNYHMRRLNAKYFIQMHNHPGGPAMFSDGDKSSAKAYLTQYGEQYLGQIVVNSLEYAEAKPYQDKRGNWKVRNRDNIGLSEAELGWEKTQQKGFFRRNTSIRPGDPLYQYDVNSETGKLLKLYNESAGLQRTNVKREESYLKGIAKLAKYLQTELNWTTIFFKGRHGEILDVQEYKDLHLLEPAQLWSFIEGEARSRGGLNVDVFVGEGDWYKTKADIAKSSWNQVLNTQHKHSGRGGTDAGIQFAWFDGLKEDNRYKDAYQQMIPTYEFEAARGISGRLHETTIDSDYGVEHGLTTPSKERDAFIEDVITDLENGDNINPYDLYRIHFNESVAMGSRHDALINKFIYFVTNQWILSKNFDPNVKSPTDAVSTYDEFRTVRTTLTHAESYLRTRLAAITEKDRVLTINDDNGELATFARAAGAATVETTNTDGYVRDLFHQVLPGVADAVHNIDPDNIAREWVGPRPTVILLNVVEDMAQKLDEAMKILAPNGRVVFLMPNTSTEFMGMGRQGMDTYWDLMYTRYNIRRLAVGGASAYVVDKRKGQGRSEIEKPKGLSADALFAKVEEIRHDRHPLTEEAIGAEFTGVGPGEQTFTQPISNPDLPAGLRLAGGQSLSLPSTDRGGPGESQGVARPAIPSRPGVGDGVSDAEFAVASTPTQTDALSGMSATPTTTPMGGSGSELGGLGAGSVGSGADVDPEMAAEPTAGQMPLQEGQVSAGARGARTRIASGQTSVEDGTLLSVSGIGGYQTGIVRQDTELGIPVTRSVERDADDVPENTPTQIPSRLRSLLTTAGAYAVLPQTGKQVLDMMRKTGQDLLTSLKRIRNFGDNVSGSGTHLLDRLHPKWKDFVHERAKADNRSFKEVYAELNEMLVRHLEGKSNTEVPDTVQNIVEAVRGYLTETFTTPIFAENNNIFRQGLLFDINEDFVNKGYLKQEHRNEVEQDRPLFDKFMRSMGQQAREKGVVQGFVQDKVSGNVYAVFVQSKTFYNRDTQQSEIIEGSETYMLEDPFGNKVKIEATEASQDLLGETKAINPLLGNHPDYTLLAYRDPGRQRWTGDRNTARTIWDDAVRDGIPDPLRDAFAENGLEYPDGANIIYSKIANIQQWDIVKDGHPLYTIKRIVPAEEAVQPTPFGSFKTYSGVHDAYADFTQKLLVYKAGEARDPIFLFKGKVPHKVWTPVENYFPHIVDWNAIDPERNRSGFEAYAQEVADANQIPLVEALDILSTRIEEAKTKKYGNLEQTRQYVFPNYRKDFFNVLDYYIIRAGHRLQTIKEFGQRNDLLEAKLLEFLSDDETLSTMSPTELAVAKLRYAAGYSDFEKGGKPQAGLPFRNESGTRLEFTPDTFNRPVGELNITPMSPADWQALIEAEFIEVLDNGNMQFTPKGIPFLENPILLKGVFAKGIERIDIAEDIIIGQLGWRKGDRFDEVGKNVARNVRNFFGLTYLGRAFIPNLSQTVNVGLTTGWRNMIRGSFDIITSDKARGEAQDVGAFAIDVMHEFGGVGSFLSRALHQQLGATPRYQVGKFGPKSFSPFAKHWEDPSIKTVPWSPFFQVERLNRGISARAGKHHAIAKIKKMIRNPERSNAARERLLSIPHAHTLKPKLNAALSVPNLSVKDMNTIRNLTEKEVREQMPHLYPVYDFLAEYAKEMADFTQHRVESLDRFKWMRDNPVLMTAALFRSFSFAQTKMLKDRLKMEWKVMHTWMNEDMGIQNKAVTKALAVGKTGFVLIPHILLATGMWGTATNLLGRISRFQEPDEEDLSFFAGVVQAGGATTFGEILYQLTHWAQGAEEAFLGPAFGTMADLTTDVVQGVRQQNLKRGLRTPLRLIRPPGYGPSAYQFLESFGESTMPPAPTTTRRNRRTPQRRNLQRRDLRK